MPSTKKKSIEPKDLEKKMLLLERDALIKTKSINYLQSVADLTFDERSMQDGMTRFCASTQEFLGWSGYRLIFVNPALRKEHSISSGAIVDAVSSAVFEEVVLKGKLLYKNTLSSNHFKGFVQCLALPIFNHNNLYMVIEFYSDMPLELSPSAMNVIDSSARLFGLLLERRTNELEIQSAQQQLIQSEKLASLGTIAAGVAHEINNPLSFLLSNLETLTIYQKKTDALLEFYEKLLEKIRTPLKSEVLIEEARKIEIYKDAIELSYIISDQKLLIAESLEGVSRISEIVQSLKTFSRNSDSDENSSDVNECILAALRVASNELKYKCEVVKDLQVVPEVPCNPGHLLQVVMNILINAAQAFDSSGKIFIKTTQIGDDVFISIQDNGCGITLENKKKLFTPFFTTKPVGKGTGLGLSVSYGIIKKLGGDISVDSEVGKGSTFTIRIPIVKKR